MIFAKEKFFSKKAIFFYLVDIQLFVSHLRARAFHIRKRVVFETIKKNFSKSFAVLKNGFIIVMYSKAKQTANKYGEKRIKK